MGDRADFTVRLIDKVKAPAKSAEKAMGRLRSENGRFVKSARNVDRAVGRSARALGRGPGGSVSGRRRSGNGRFLPGGGGGRRGGGGGGRSDGRFRDKLGRLREKNGRFVGGMGGAGGGGMWDVFKGNLLTMAATKIAGVAAAIAQAGAGMVTFGQNTRMALGNLTKHGAIPEKLFEHSRALATRFGLDVQGTTDQYKKFLALQFTPKGADKLIKMGADLRAMGTDAEGVQGVFMALGQIKGKGRLQGEEMLQLAERGISTSLVHEEIGKLMGGKSTDEVRKLQQAGKVTADVGLQAIENAINRKLGQSKLGESGAKFADRTIEGMIGRIKSLGENAGITLVDQVTGPVTKLAGQGLDALEGFLSSASGASTIENIANALGKAAEYAGMLASAFGPAFGATWSAIAEGASTMFSVFAGGDGKDTEALVRALGKGLGEIAAVAVGVALGLGVVAAGVGLLLGPLYEVGKAIVIGLVEPLAKMAADMVVVWETVLGIFDSKGLTLRDKTREIGIAVIRGLGDGITSMLNYPIDAISGIATQSVEALRNIFDVHSPSRVTKAIGKNVARGLALGADSQSGMVAASGERLAGSQLSGLDYGPEVSSVSRPAALDGGPMSSGPITVYLTTEVNGAGGDAEEVGRVAARESRRELESFFRQLSMEV